ncbi:MAG: hypothetical protein ACYCXP_11405 [Leptospirillum sp.]|nr:hypothetical protein [Nitrospiraceae bacterium]
MIRFILTFSKNIALTLFSAPILIFISHNAWGADPQPNAQPVVPQTSQTPPSAQQSGNTSPNSLPVSSSDTENTSLSRNGRDAIEAYRHSWNPMTAGPNYMPQADSLPEGEFNGRFFFYGALTEGEYSDSGGINGLPQGFSKNQLLALFAMFYGVDANTELVFLPSLLGTFSSYQGQVTDGAGFNDTTIGIKHRWVIQNPWSSRPSFSTALLVTVPTSSWLGTPLPKSSSLPPLSVVPSTHLGEPSLTAVFLTRKNIKPVRIYGDFLYSYAFPGSGVLPGATKSTFNQYGDIAQYRLGIEDVINDQRGLGIIMEFVGLSGLPFSIDGNTVSTHPNTFNIFAVQPTLEVNLTERLAMSAGVLLPAFGTNEYLAVTPNFSLWYYWGDVGGKVLPR